MWKLKLVYLIVKTYLVICIDSLNYKVFWRNPFSELTSNDHPAYFTKQRGGNLRNPHLLLCEMLSL